eukprot:gene34596-42673_t
MQTLRDDATLHFEQMIDLCGVDYSTYGEGTWDGLRFAVVSHLLSVKHNWRVRVRVFAPDDDMPVVFDSALKQMICNVLDNALEASPEWIRLEATCEDGALKLLVSDNGPGFAPEILEQFGKPYNSSKGKPGRGLGLFLTVNVARTLGGTVTASNRPEGGAAVLLSLPLTAIAVEEE